MSIDAALARNHGFAEAGGHEGATARPNLGLIVITCMDPRVDPAHFLGLDVGDAFVLRSAGARVTPDVIDNVALIAQMAESAQPEGSLDVAVIHHTDCGTAALARDEGFRRRYAERIGAPESNVRGLAVTDPEVTVRHDVELLRAAPAIAGRVSLSGHVYDVASGRVRTIL